MTRYTAPRIHFVTAGERIGRGVVIDPEIRTDPTPRKPSGIRAARLRCDCGNIYEALINNLVEKNGKINTKSCGCGLVVPTGRPPVLSVETGQRIGRGVVIDPAIRTGFTRAVPGGHPGARLRCDCGTIYEAALMSLVERNGHVNTQSCGCLRDDNAVVNGVRSATHGLGAHPLYGTWRQMLQRCENPEHHNYRYYGARGRTVCARWHDVRLFIQDIERDIGPRPEGMTLDRTDNAGNYEPGNVRWATPKEQIANTGY